MSETKWCHTRWVVLVMLFLVLGPFGLPLLWKSPLQMLVSTVAAALRTLSSMGLGW